MIESKTQMALIGAALDINDSQTEKILEAGVSRADFLGDSLRVWIEVEKLFSGGVDVTLLKMYNALPTLIDFLDECLAACSSTAFTQSVIEDVQKETMLRDSATLAIECMERLEGAKIADVEDIVADIQKSWLDVNIQRESSVSLPEEMAAFIQRCEDGEAGIIPWFLESIQRRYGKLTEEFIVIHALPSIGKTALIIQWIAYLHSNGFKTAFASLESSVRGIAPRFISHMAQVNTLHMKTNASSPQTVARAKETIQAAEDLAFCIRDGHMTDGQLMAWCRIQKQNGAQIIFIDNLRHIDSATKYESETRKFMEISLAVKRIRDQLKIPVVLLHHSNEDGDVGWCKDIKKDVDVLLYLEKSVEISDGVDEVNLVFQKGRDAGTFLIPTIFDKQVQTYLDK